MGRVYNFSAGPAVLPEEVLREAADEMLDYKGCGMSVMEMSHRSKVFDDIIKEAEQDLRDLMNIPDNYKVLFLQGGASQQFSAIPMNLMKNGVADYIVTGQWAKKAYQEASRYGKAVKIASSEDKTFFSSSIYFDASSSIFPLKLPSSINSANGFSPFSNAIVALVLFFCLNGLYISSTSVKVSLISKALTISSVSFPCSSIDFKTASFLSFKFLR